MIHVIASEKECYNGGYLSGIYWGLGNYEKNQEL